MAAVRYRFRDFTLDPAGRELLRDGELVTLPSRSLDCLIYLIQHRDRAVGRDELISAVWGRVDIADGLLAQTILRLRRGLGDSGSEGAIRTVARFGYRWVEDTVEESTTTRPLPEPVDVAAEAASAPAALPIDAVQAPVASAQALRRRSGYRRPALLVTLAGVIGLVVALAVWLRQPTDDPVAVVADATPPDTAQRPALAIVLPVAVEDASGQGWLRLGLMDMIANRLRAAGVATMPSENVMGLLVDAGDGPVAAGEGALLVRPAIGQLGEVWRMTLMADANTQVMAEAADPVDAAVAAADLLLIRLGKRMPAATRDQRPLELDALLLRVRAAVLAEQFDTARELLDQAPDALRGQPPIELEYARMEQGQGRYADAEQRLQGLLERLDGADEPGLRGRALAALGGIQFRRLNVDAAAGSFANAIELLERAGEHDGLAQAYMGRAAIASRQERLDEAAADLGRARVEMEAAGDPVGVAQIDMNLGLIQIKRYRPASGLPLLREAEARFVVMGANEPLVYVRYLQVGAQLQLLDMQAARRTAALFSPPQDHTGNERLRWRLALTRVFLLVAEGQLRAAQDELALIRSGATAPDDRAVLVGAQAMAVLVDSIRWQDQKTVAALGQALSDELRSLRPDLHVSVWTAWLRGLRQTGDVEAARRETQAFARFVADNPNPWRDVHRALALAEQAWFEQPGPAALDRFAAAFDLAQQLAVPEDLVHVAEPYVAALIAQDQIDRASAVVGRVAAWADQDLRAAWAQATLFRAQGRTAAYQRALVRVDALRGERRLPGSPAE